MEREDSDEAIGGGLAERRRKDWVPGIFQEGSVPKGPIPHEESPGGEKAVHYLRQGRRLRLQDGVQTPLGKAIGGGVHPVPPGIEKHAPGPEGIKVR